MDSQYTNFSGGGERLEIEKAIKIADEDLQMIKEDWNQEIKDKKYDKIRKQMRRQLQMFMKYNREENKNKIH